MYLIDIEHEREALKAYIEAIREEYLTCESGTEESLALAEELAEARAQLRALRD